MSSIWWDYAKRPHFRSLLGDIKTDVLILGGGIAGILCAYMLKGAGVDYVLAEAKEICSGITADTTAKITLQHGFIYDKMIKRFGKERAQMYLKAQIDALEQYKRLSKKTECDFDTMSSYVYSLEDTVHAEREVRALESLGCRAELSFDTGLPFDIKASVKVEGQGQINPLKLLFLLAKDLKIYENTKVRELTPEGAITDKGKIRAKKIIIATHFPIINKHGMYFLKMYQHRSYVIALDGAPDVNGMYVDQARSGLSFRNYKGYMLLGGGSHRTGKQGGAWRELEDFAKEFYPNAKIKGKWATQDCMTLDDIPYIGRYSARTDDMYVITGFNKWGMTSAMAGARILCDLVLGKDNEYAPVFSPSRSVLRPRLFGNTAHALAGWLKPTSPRCPHLGCALKYNKQEHSWDCSCHGSRFEKNGRLIDNPATDDKIFKH